MTWTNVKLIFLREFRDQLRDRRTLFVIVVLPLLLYPLLGMTFLQMSQFLRQHPSRALLVTDGELQAFPPLVDGDRLVEGLDREHRITVELAQIEGSDIDTVQAMAIAEIDSDRQDVVVYFPTGFAANQSVQTDAPTDESIDHVSQPKQEPGPAQDLRIIVNSARDRSRLAGERIRLALTNWKTQIVEQNLRQHELRESVTSPFDVVTLDIASPEIRRAALWSKILPLVILLWAMTGAFYPAIDLCAGEKERGTLETLLSSPAERIEIVWGKLLTVMTFSIATALLNLLCLCVTAAFVFSSFSPQFGAALDFGPPPLLSLIWLVPILIPVAALFGALSLALATMARSTKEGQYYLMPVLLITMPLVTLSMLPSTKLDLGTSLIPLTGLALLVRNLMEGEYAVVLLHALPVFIVTAGCCWFAIRWAVDQFNNESVLFLESERFSVNAWLMGVVRDRGPLPSAAEAILCGVIILLLRFFVGLHVPTPTNWIEFVTMVAVTMLAVITAPALLMATMLTTKPLQTLLLRRTSWTAVPIAAALAVCLHPVALGLSSLVRHLYPIDSGTHQSMAKVNEILNTAPSTLQLLVVIALLPAICEELAFRGFILSGLRRLGSKWRAIIVSSIFFGLAHFALQQSVITGIFGLVLGYLAVQTGSLLPCIAFHMVLNGLNVLSAKFIPTIIEHWPGLSFLFEKTVVFDQVSYVYSWPVLIVAGLLTLLLFRWFRSHGERTYIVEERLREAIDKNAPVSMALR